MSKILNEKVPGLTQAVPVLSILMEVFWSYAWLVWIGSISTLGWTQPPLNLISSLVLAVFCEILTRFSLARKWSLKRVRLIVLPFNFLLLLLLVRLNVSGGYGLAEPGWMSYAPEHITEIAIGLIFGVYLIWRGLSTGGQPNPFRAIYNRFLFGLAALIFLLVIWGITGGEISTIGSSAGIYTILFFGTGLLAMACANLEALRAEMREHQEAVAAFNRRWVSLLVVLVLVILGIGIAFTAIYSSDTVETIAHALGIFGDWLLTALIYLLYPVAFIASGFYYLARWIVGLLRNDQEMKPMEGMGMQEWKDMTQGESAVQIPEAVLLALKWIAILLVISLIVFFLARILVRRSQGKSQEDVEEEHENFWSWNLISEDLRALLAWLFRWMRRRKAPCPDKAENIYSIPSIEEASGRLYSIREIYRAWLWEAGHRWSPRRRSETAFEYRRRLGTSADQVSEELDSLTEAYIKERYGEEKTEDEQLKGLNRLWHNIRAKLSSSEQL
ncbi:MAG: DUF4129 domain-containing protein [Dehalococcoidales bacterium]|nr:DUF4129 domain-containing protein [Dehalococcoidales bacterium]